MGRRRRVHYLTGRCRRRGCRGECQKGSILPLLALTPALAAVGKASALGAVGAGAGLATKAVANKIRGGHR